jgi:hypothetical protein
MKTNVYRGGKVHVCARMCSTCIFRPGNLMRLPEGRVEGMVASAVKSEGVIPCHHTTYGGHPDGEAVCRGFYDLRATATLRLAAALRVIARQEPELKGVA